MSSSYSYVDLEALRKQRIKAELDNAIRQAKDQMKVKHDNSVHMTAAANIDISVVVEDNAAGGYSGGGVVKAEALQSNEGKSETKRDELDFSGLLQAKKAKPSRLELELDSWVKKVDERPVVTEKDEKDRARVIAEIAKAVESPLMDIEDKIQSVKMRVSTYLQGAVRLTEADKERMESTYLEYCVLCDMLEVMPVEKIPHRVEKEVARMTAVLEKRKQEEYVMEVIEEIMEDLGCHVKEDAVLDHTIGQMYSIDGHPLCEVFVGSDDRGIMFEPVGESKGGSLDHRRQVENDANSVCSLYKTIEERAAEKGVILSRVYADPAEIDKMAVQTDISERRATKKRQKAGVLKQRALDSEG